MVSRLTLLLYLAEAKGQWWVVEQPRGSLLESHPRFARFCQDFEVVRFSCKMGDFGAETEKPTWLYSSKKFVEELALHKERTWKRSMTTVRLASNTMGDDGVNRVTGIKDLLKKSQVVTNIERVTHACALLVCHTVQVQHSEHPQKAMKTDIFSRRGSLRPARVKTL